MSAIFKSKAYGTATLGERGQIVIPAGLRRDLNIKSGDQLMVFAKLDKRVISIMPEKDFSKFLEKASKIISKLENKIQRRHKIAHA